MTVAPVESTKSRILSEAEKLFAGRGYDGVSMREIAEAAGVTKANIYYYFQDKQSLYLEILQTDMLVLISALDQAAGTEGPCRERLERLAETFWHLMRAKNSLIQLTLRQFGIMEIDVRGLVVRHLDEMLRPIVGVLADGMRDGELREVNPRLAAVTFMGALSILLTGYLLDLPTQRPLEDSIKQVVALFVDGVGVREAVSCAPVAQV